LHGCRFRRGFDRHDFFDLAGVAALALGLVDPAFSPARAEGFSPSQKAETEAIIKDYLAQNPDRPCENNSHPRNIDRETRAAAHFKGSGRESRLS
jgi:hypothetical protein